MNSDLRTRKAPLGTTGRPVTLDKSRRTVQCVAASEAPVRVYDWEIGPVDEVLVMTGLVAPGQVPLLDSHYRDSTRAVLGSASGFTVQGELLLALAAFSETDAGERNFQLVAEGHLTDFSVGYRVLERRRLVEGESLSLNGKTYTGPLLLALRWEVKELSVCPIGADPNAKARALAKPKGSTMTTVNPTEPTTPNPEEQVRAAVAAERERVAEINAMGRRHNCQDVTDQAVSNGSSFEQARRAVLAELERRQAENPQVLPSIRYEMGITDTERFNRAASDALLLRGGIRVKDPAGGAAELQAFSLREIAREALQRAGQRVPADLRELVGRAMTTSDLPNILSATVNKALVDGFEAAPETWESWCGVGSLPDFKPATLARLGAMGSLEEVPEQAEYQHVALDDQGERVKLATFGKILTISRQTLINDDLAALTDLPREMGFAAARTCGDVAYEVLNDNPTMADGLALFHASHGNLATPAAAPSTDAFAKGDEAMSTQKDIGNKALLGLRPEFLVAPIALRAACEALLGSAELWTVSAAGVQTKTHNLYFGLLKPVYDARLDLKSKTAWYLAARPGTGVKVYFLNGIRTPYVEQREEFTRDTMAWKVRLDCAAAPCDYRGVFKNAGA